MELEEKLKREVGREICDMPVTGGMKERRGRTDGGGREGGRKGTCDRERGVEEGGRSRRAAYVNRRTIRGVHDTSPGGRARRAPANRS